jgi:large subunit ribosomal protein L33
LGRGGRAGRVGLHQQTVVRREREEDRERSTMAKGATKAGAILVKLVSTAQTGFFYVRRKNPKKLPKKLEFIKYDPRVSGARRKREE